MSHRMEGFFRLLHFSYFSMLPSKESQHELLMLFSPAPILADRTAP